jgi:type II secretory pathway pseudopilin PulG
MVVVTIISLLMLAAAPTYNRIQRKARATTISNDFRVFAAAFQAHAHESGAWPAAVADAGIVPPEMTAVELKPESWTRVTPMGGQFGWEYMTVNPGGTSPGGRWRAAISIKSTSTSTMLVDADLLEEIDQTLDDGDLTNGSFRLSGDGGPLYILEP